MSFNPFQTFRKHQKIWMASILLVCMVTFVLCAGFGQGDFGDWLIRKMNWRQGPVVAKIDNTDYSLTQMDNIRTQRKIANDYMRAATKITLKNIDEQIKAANKVKDKKTRESKLGQLYRLKKIMNDHLREPFYFGSGTKLEDLVKLILWKKQADRLGIQLTDESVNKMVQWRMLAPQTGFNFEASIYAEREVKQEHYNKASTESITEALRQEFRVELAKLSFMGARTQALMNPGVVDFNMDTRFALSPDQLWKTYKEKLTNFDVTMIPVKVEEYISEIDEVSEIQVKALFEDNKDVPYDPSSDRPGFRDPAMAKIQYVLTDPDAEHFKELAAKVTLLEKYPPIFFDAGMPVFGTAVRYWVGQPAWETSILRDYESEKGNQKRAIFFRQVSLSQPYFALTMFSRFRDLEPMAIAGLVGGVAGNSIGFTPGAPYLYQAGIVSGYGKKSKEKIARIVHPSIKEEIKRRVPVGASLFLASVNKEPFSLLASRHFVDTKPQFLPFSMVKETLRERRERLQIVDHVKEIMVEVKEFLDSPNVQGKPEEMRVRLVDLQGKYPGLEVYETTEYRSKFDIDEAQALKKFKESYNEFRDRLNYFEGRKGKESELKKEDFWKLFFDTTEAFSVAQLPNYTMQQWPPVAQIPEQNFLLNLPEIKKKRKNKQEFNLWSALADRRILFWKTQSKLPTRYKSWKEIKDRVVFEWKKKKARNIAFDKAAEIAQKIRKAQITAVEISPVMDQIAAELGIDLMVLKNVSQWQPYPDQAGVFYIPYKLEPGIIPYPREDTTKQIIALNDLQEPLKTKDAKKKKNPGADPRLDNLNAKLFRKDLVGKDKKQIQVLTNLPRSVYYVATVTRSNPPPFFAFLQSYKQAAAAGEKADLFMVMARQEAAKKFVEDLTNQLWNQAEVSALDKERFDD